METPLMVFDGDCTFCKLWIDYWKQLTDTNVDYAPYQEAAERFPHVPRENFEKAVHLILPDGTVHSGACAVLCSLQHHRRYSVLYWLYRYMPGFSMITEWAYGIVARNRDFFYHLTKRLWGDRFPHEMNLERWMLVRALGMVSVLMIASLLPKVLRGR